MREIHGEVIVVEPLETHVTPLTLAGRALDGFGAGVILVGLGVLAAVLIAGVSAAVLLGTTFWFGPLAPIVAAAVMLFLVTAFWSGLSRH